MPKNKENTDSIHQARREKTEQGEGGGELFGWFNGLAHANGLGQEVEDTGSCSTNRPDLFLVSDSSKRMGVIKLTVPNEDRVEVANEMKRMTYVTL